jgi:hypothetical protein
MSELHRFSIRELRRRQARRCENDGCDENLTEHDELEMKIVVIHYGFSWPFMPSEKKGEVPSEI